MKYIIYTQNKNEGDYIILYCINQTNKMKHQVRLSYYVLVNKQNAFTAAK